MNFARLNHVLIPGTKDERDRLRGTRFSRYVVRPLARTYFALSELGHGLLAIALIASLLGLDVLRGQNHLLWAVLFALVVASLVVRPLFTLPDVRIEVDGPGRIAVGGEARFRVRLENDGGRAHPTLVLRRPFLPWDGTWIGDLPRPVALAPGGRVQIELAARFVERGHHHLDAFGVGAGVPLNLAIGPLRESRGTRFVVVPRVARIAAMQLSERARYQQGGVVLASHTGESLEIVGLRPYREGDRIRDINPRGWARLGVPVVREYQQEYFSRVALVLDTDSSQAGESQIEALISLAAGVVEHLGRGESLIDLIVLGDGSPAPTIGRSLATFEHALDHLADVSSRSGFDGESDWRRLEPRLERLSAVVWLSPCWDAARAAFVRRIEAAGVECSAIVVSPRAPDGSPSPDAGANLRRARRSDAVGAPGWLTPARIEAACSGGAGLLL